MMKCEVKSTSTFTVATSQFILSYMQSLNDIKQLLASVGTHPKKRFGQNFLHDHNQLRRILTAAEVVEGSVVLEVGAGTGALTEAMLEAGASVIAVEVDDDLVIVLRERLTGFDATFELIHGDVLSGKHAINRAVLEAIERRRDGGGFSLVANLPYNIASPLLVNLAMQQAAMQQAVVMVQKEVADRIVAGPGSGAFGPLGIVLASAYEPSVVTRLPASCFYPPPKIESAVIRLVRREQLLTDDLHAFSEFVHMLFNKRRKQLGAILGRNVAFPDDIDPTQRPETLSLEQMERLRVTCS